MGSFPLGTRVTCALPNIKRIGTPESRVQPRSPLRRDLESAGQGTHLIEDDQDNRSPSFRRDLPGPSQSVLSWVPPGLVLGAAVVLVLAQLFHVAWHSPHRRYLAVLLLTAAGVLAGQLWDALGLPALRLGELDLLPAVLFAAALQPLARRVTLLLP